MKIIPVILAGGVGERFWPFSRSSMPKQLLPLISRRSMVEETLERIAPLCARGTKPLIVTSKTIAPVLRKRIPGSIQYDCIAEPVGRNTAPAVAIAAAWIAAGYGDDAVMAVLSADHAISPQNTFLRSVRYAADLAASLDLLVVFGIQPVRPDTGYGYIELGQKLGRLGEIGSFRVKRFVEKPSAEKAKRYLRSKNYLWNSGMFVWKVSVILEEFARYMPSIHDGVGKAAAAGFSKKAIDAFYRACEKESIDYGIMEQSARVAAVKGVFHWDDVGSWESLCRLLPQNANQTVVSGGRSYERECVKTIIANNSKMAVAAIGLSDAVLVVADDAVLAIARDKLPAFKKYLAEIKKHPEFPQTLF